MGRLLKSSSLASEDSVFASLFDKKDDEKLASATRNDIFVRIYREDTKNWPFLSFQPRLISAYLCQCYLFGTLEGFVKLWILNNTVKIIGNLCLLNISLLWYA